MAINAVRFAVLGQLSTVLLVGAPQSNPDSFGRLVSNPVYFPLFFVFMWLLVRLLIYIRSERLAGAGRPVAVSRRFSRCKMAVS
jgi:hypothetical protein